MVHMSYVPAPGSGPESTRKYQSDAPLEEPRHWTAARDTERGTGLALGPGTWRLPKRPGGRDERGAEMVEFAFVVVLLIALLYGIISYGLVLAAQSTLTQAAADAARSGIVVSPAATAVTTAEGEAANDVGWMGKGCHEHDVPGSPSSPITCTAVPESCPSNMNSTCLAVTVTYDYASS